jgi:hypothetical protein
VRRRLSGLGWVATSNSHEIADLEILANDSTSPYSRLFTGVILWAANAVHAVDMALFPVWSGVFLGLGVLLVAVALWLSSEYSRSFAAFGVIGGSMCLAFALSGIFGFSAPLPLWPWGPAVDGIWMALLGAMMLRKAPRPAQTSTAPIST